MSLPEREMIEQALSEALVQALGEDRELHVPYLGRFRVHHQESRIENQPDGRLLMKPPRDVIAFSAE